MKPRQVADIIGFVSYYYAVNRRLPGRHVIDFALREASVTTAARQLVDSGRETAAGLDAQPERQEEHVSTPAA